MANDRIRNPPGCAVPKNTSLTRGGMNDGTHLVLGPYTTGSSAGLTCCMLVSVTNAGVLAKHTVKVPPAGVIIYSPDYNWGSTTPTMTATLPDTIEVMICARGPCLIAMDIDKVIDAAYLGACVYDGIVAGYCCIASTAAPTVIGEAGHYPIGRLLDLQAGNQAGTTYPLMAGSDGDVAEVDFGNLAGQSCVVSSA